MHLREIHPEQSARVSRALASTAERIAPVWPLANFVAVNPYMGFVDSSFGSAAQNFRYTHGADLLMPLEFYFEALDAGEIQRDDIREALTKSESAEDVQRFIARTRASKSESDHALQTVTDVAAEIAGIDLSRFMTDQISKWASGYFDEGQAGWGSPFKDQGLFTAWRAEAEIDRGPEVMGIREFRASVARLPDDPHEAAFEALQALSVAPDYAEIYLQRISSRVAGWVAFAARVAWDDRLYRGESSAIVEEFLAVLLAWEYAVFRAYEGRDFEIAWHAARERIEEASGSGVIDGDLLDRLIFQNAYENAEERALLRSFEEPARIPEEQATRPLAQVVFCIDVRSEIYRRHLEASEPRTETLGFAGFFGMPIRFRPLAHQEGAPQCPALISPSHDVRETCGSTDADQKACARRESRNSVQKLWKSFAQGAVSCFGFVSPLGLTRLPMLFLDAFGVTTPVPHPSIRGLSRSQARSLQVDISAIDHESRVELAANALVGMSLTDRFARLVVIAGHGASVVNNPHASGYDCGACGGRSGEPNARVAAAILNDGEVRLTLRERGIDIPEDTVFVAALHDTTSDDMKVFSSQVPESHLGDLEELETAFDTASRASRAERAPRLGLHSDDAGEIDKAIRRRSRDWAQVRPEWGLAGCSSFVVAPRKHTRGIDLGGRAFLHNYSWRQDEDFDVLESIMTAPMVVTSWINLQYYASTVDNRVFGSGNKTLHNVVGTVGVLEGNAGDLRVGLPWQAVQNGTLQHRPLRLKVVIEAPIEAMNQVIATHESIRHLVDNGWLQLYAMNAEGQVSHRYQGEMRWACLEDASDPEFVRATA